jgi:hypothetical protein
MFRRAMAIIGQIMAGAASDIQKFIAHEAVPAPARALSLAGSGTKSGVNRRGRPGLPIG